MKHTYSLAEALVERLTPLSWDESKGGLRVDEERLDSEGMVYVQRCALMAMAFLLSMVLVGDLADPGMLIPKVFLGVSATLGLAMAAAALMILKMIRGR